MMRVVFAVAMGWAAATCAAEPSHSHRHGPGTMLVAPSFGYACQGGFGSLGYFGSPLGSYYGPGYAFGATALTPLGGYYGPGYAFGATALTPLGYDAFALENQRQRQRQQQQAEAAAAESLEQREAAAKLAAERRGAARQDKGRFAERHGRTQFAAGQYRRAAERFKEALDAEPEAVRHFLLAQAKFAQKRYAEAAQEVRNGLRAHPDWPGKPFDVRTLYGVEADFVGQLGMLAGEVKANPADADALFLFGYELFAAGRRVQARAVLEAARKADAAGAGIDSLLDAAK